MKIYWDEAKNKILKETRKVSFEEVEICILKGKYLDILENKKYKGQLILILEINDYIHAVPFVMNDKKEIFLKTIYASRKYNKKYFGGENESL
jgi:uncharacterized DUF497 family protein